MPDWRLHVRPRMTVLASLVVAALAATPAGASEAGAKAQPEPKATALQTQPEPKATALQTQPEPKATALQTQPEPKATALQTRKAPEAQVQANSPPFSDGIFPCSGCHDGKEKVNAAPRELVFHNGEGEPATVLKHGAERWCLDCHDATNRDVLRSAAGQPIPYTESYRLCGQCHGDKYRDWKVGVHGKRTGQWDGAKVYFLCVNCHNPHTPGWKGVDDRVVDGKRVVSPTLELLKPEPMPFRPQEMRMSAEQITKARAQQAPAKPAKEAHP